MEEFCDSLQTGRETFPVNFNTVLRFRVNYKEPSLELSGYYEFPWKLHISFSAKFTLISDENSKPVSKAVFRDRFSFYKEKTAIFEVILSICSEFS